MKKLTVDKRKVNAGGELFVYETGEETIYCYLVGSPEEALDHLEFINPEILTKLDQNDYKRICWGVNGTYAVTVGEYIYHIKIEED